MRVTVVTTSFPLGEGSVSGIFVERLVRHLPPPIQATVVTPCLRAEPLPPTPATHRLECFRYAPRRFQTLAHAPGGLPSALDHRDPALLFLPSFLFSLVAACVRHAGETDIFHANWSLCGLACGLAGRLRGVPVVTTLRGRDANIRGSWIYALPLALCLRLSDRIVTVSEAMASILIERFPGAARKIEVIPNGVSESLLTAPSRAEHDTASEPLRLLFVGSLVANKDVSALLRGLSLLGREVRLTVVGDGPLRAALESEARALGVAERVDFVGACAPDEVPSWLADADALVLPSHSEGRPNVVLEAMAAGVPVVASDLPGVRELVVPGESGLVFPAGDVGALHERLVALRDDRALRGRLARSARNTVRRLGLTWTATGRRYGALFSEVLGERAPGSRNARH